MAIVPNLADPAGKFDLNQNVLRKPVTVANGATVSSVVFCGGQMIVGLDTGPALTSVGITFETSQDGVNWRLVEDEAGNAVALVVEGNRYVHINPPMAGLDRVRLVMGAAEGAARNLVLIMVP